MRFRIFLAGLLLLSLAGCGAADTSAPPVPAANAPATAAPSSPATAAPAAQAQPTAASTHIPPTQPQPAPTEVPTMQDPASPTPESSPIAPTKTRPARPARPTLQAAPPHPQETAVLADIPPNSAVVAPPLGPALTKMVDDSRADLARRKSAALDDVALVQVWTVVWPDGGLGCPRPGMVYPQVQVDGLLIRLQLGGQTFDYHGDGRKPPFLCE